MSANQLQVDSILSTINRISNSTNFQGKNLLDGTLGYTTSSTGTSAFAAIAVNAANLPNNKAEAIVVQVTSSATQGSVLLSSANNALKVSGVTLQISGTNGTEQLSFRRQHQALGHRRRRQQHHRRIPASSLLPTAPSLRSFPRTTVPTSSSACRP